MNPVLSYNTPPPPPDARDGTQTGTKIVIMERYTCKADLTEVHQQSAPFLAFREHPAQQLVVRKSGQSYVESNVGYAMVPSKGY